jgi:hypothetical protein
MNLDEIYNMLLHVYQYVSCWVMSVLATDN